MMAVMPRGQARREIIIACIQQHVDAANRSRTSETQFIKIFNNNVLTYDYQYIMRMQ